MNTFDSVRYWIGLLLLMWGPGSVLYWVVVHPFAGHWRRVGARWAYAAGFGLVGALALLVWLVRGYAMAADYGPSAGTVAAGVVLLGAAFALRRQWSRRLRKSTLLGRPEVDAASHPGQLLTDGIYAHVRHPRYLQVFLATAGWALISNYVAAYVALGILTAGLAVVIPLEERELVARFGDAYEQYRRRVPAILPRMRS